jgi:hypothetical protein
MSSRQRLLRITAALGLVLLVSMLTAAAGQAASWGEIGHFAEAAGELGKPEPAFGVNPEDGSVWVVDTVTVGSEFRIQKFEKVGGVYKAVASRVFKPKDPVAESEVEVEGVAFDSKLKRAYVLTDEERPGKSESIDPYDQAASELYAFSTQTKEGKIEFASGTVASGPEEGVLASPKTLEPTSQKHGHSLIAPGGITVDAANDQILVTGWVDRGKLGKEEETTPSVWAITETGALAGKWEDESGFFEECGCVNSPVVTSTGHIYVLASPFEIDEIPSSLESKTPAKRVFDLPWTEICHEEACKWEEGLTEFQGFGGEEGAEMSIGVEGDIYVRDRVKLASEKNSRYGGVMVLSPGLSELGWVGGGSSASQTGVCSVNELEVAPNVAAGKETVFMLSRGDAGKGVPPKILQLGPGGTGCPGGSSTPISAKAGGVELSSFPAADKIAFSSELTQANAVSTEWEFEHGVEHGATEDVSERQQQKTFVEHKYATEGTFRVVEKIHTDNLATPIIEKERTVTILGAPKVRKEEALVEGTAATLKAEVNPNLENVTKCQFEYGPAAEALGGAGTKVVACHELPGEGEEFVPESTKVTGLEEGKEYRFRLLAESVSGKTASTEGTKFLVPQSGAPEAKTLAASNVTSSGATLNGQVNPKKVQTSCKFEYGTTLPSGKFAECATSPGSGEGFVTVSATLTTLSGNTTYQFKLLAENSGGKKGEGSTLEFRTSEPVVKPTVETGTNETLQTAATLAGKVNPGGEAGTCVFEYGPTLPDKTVPCATSPGAGRSPVAVSASLSELAPGTTYKYKLVAKNSAGTGEGIEATFTTKAKAAPTAVTGSAAAVTKTTATLAGSVDPQGEVTNCRFLYGTTTAYGSEASCSPAPGDGTASVAVSAAIAGLAPNTTYHYKLIAQSTGGTGEGVDQQLKTAEEPPVVKPPEHGVEPSITEKPIPVVAISGSPSAVAGSGSFTVKLTCPSKETQCSGTVTLKTLTAVAASAAHASKAKKAILTLASGSFTIAGGGVKVLTLHLSAKARALLAKSHTLKAKVTIVAHDPDGTTHTTTAVVTLKAAKRKH